VVEGLTPSVLSVSYEESLGAVLLGSLGVALFMSGAFFKMWEHTFRDALGGLYTRGSVDDTPSAHYLEFSKKQTAWFSSPWRLLPILSCVAFSSPV